METFANSVDCKMFWLCSASFARTFTFYFSAPLHRHRHSLTTFQLELIRRREVCSLSESTKSHTLRFFFSISHSYVVAQLSARCSNWTGNFSSIIFRRNSLFALNKSSLRSLAEQFSVMKFSHTESWFLAPSSELSCVCGIQSHSSAPLHKMARTGPCGALRLTCNIFLVVYVGRLMSSRRAFCGGWSRMKYWLFLSLRSTWGWSSRLDFHWIITDW